MSSLKLSTALSQIKQSPTIHIKLLADSLIQAGRKIYDLGVGELVPTHPMPESLKEEIINAIKNDETTYCNNQGDHELRVVLSNDFKKNFGMDYSPEEIVITPGPKPAINISMIALLDPRAKKNRVISFLPIYEAFEAIPLMITQQPTIFIDVDENLQPNISKLEETLKSRDDIAAVIINSPNNPTGVLYTEETLKRIANILSQYPDIAIISDEVYRVVVYNDKPYLSIAHLLPLQTIVVGGMSKEVSGTGVRIGFAAGPKHVIKAMAHVIGSTISCTNLPVQKGYARFLKKDLDMTERNKIRELLRKKKDLVCKKFNELSGLKKCTLITPGGSFFLFPDLSAFLGKKTSEDKVLVTDEDLCTYILEKSGVVIIPGSFFGKPGNVRISYGVSTEDDLVVALEKLSETLESLIN